MGGLVEWMGPVPGDGDDALEPSLYQVPILYQVYCHTRKLSPLTIVFLGKNAQVVQPDRTLKKNTRNSSKVNV